MGWKLIPQDKPIQEVFQQGQSVMIEVLKQTGFTSSTTMLTEKINIILMVARYLEMV